MSKTEVTNGLSQLSLSDLPARPSTSSAISTKTGVTGSATPLGANGHVNGTWTDDVAAYTGRPGPRLSKRAVEATITDAPEGLDKLLRSAYDKDSNPDGLINIGLAENTLLTDEYLEFFRTTFKDNFTALDLTYGNQSSGSRRLHTAIADFWTRSFDPIEPVLPDQIITGPGATGVLDQLVSTLCDPGEGVMISAPHYNGFDVNMPSRSGAKIVSVEMPFEDMFTPKAIDYFEKALVETWAKGIEVKAILLCNPHNPYGITYARASLLAYASFAERHNLHLISDEIYALSVFDNPNMPDAPPFVSMLAIDLEKELGGFDRSRLHIVYSVSKDFGANGLRIGVIISQHNPFLLRAMLHTYFIMKVSSPADVLFSALLNDKPTLERLTAENQRQLAKWSAHVRDWFEARGGKPMQSNAAHFMFIDCRDILGISIFEEEKEFLNVCMDKGIFVAVGSSYKHPVPGFLRITFSVSPPLLLKALERLDEAIAEYKKIKGRA